MTSMRGAALVVTGLSLVLAGCGFTPLYGARPTGTVVSNEFAAIGIDPIGGRVGLEVQNNLIDLLTPAGVPASPQYQLTVTLREGRQGLAIQKDSSITRYNYQLFGAYRLVDTKSGQIVDSGEARAIAAYNVVEAQFATLAAEKDAEVRAARELAQEIRIRLGVAFDRRPVPAAGAPTPAPTPTP